MGNNAYLIRVSSQKGGVGKTTVAVNLASALSLSGNRTLLVDADLANPSIGFHLGLEQANQGLSQLLSGKAKLQNLVVKHAATGLSVLPEAISKRLKKQNYMKMPQVLDMLKKSNYDFVVVDTSPGVMLYEPLDKYDEVLVVATPDMPALTSAIRLMNMYRGKTKTPIVLNRLRNKGFEINFDEIEEATDEQIIARLPENDIVPTEVSEHIPAYVLNPKNPFSKEMYRLSRKYSAKMGEAYTNVMMPTRGGGIIGFLRRLFFG